MKVILLERLEGWGSLGDVVNVKDGYARNFLLPRHKALRANAANMKVFDAQRAEIEARNAKAREAAGPPPRPTAPPPGTEGALGDAELELDEETFETTSFDETTAVGEDD